MLESSFKQKRKEKKKKLYKNTEEKIMAYSKSLKPKFDEELSKQLL